MIGIEPLPGLLDDPDYQLPSLPVTRADFYIAPLRNPVPHRNVQAGSSFESLPRASENGTSHAKKDLHLEDDNGYGHSSTQTGGRDKKKPHLAISELVDTTQIVDTQPTQLPSFVSLSAVERSPIPPPSYINLHKRLRLDIDSETAHHEVNRLLPRPAAKDDKKARPVPLLPAMVTGLHEPPPSAGLLPSMDLDAPPGRTINPPSKLKVKDILSEPVQHADRRPPEAMINSPEPRTARLSKTVPETVSSQRRESETEDNTNSEETSKAQAQTHEKPEKGPSEQSKILSTPQNSTSSREEELTTTTKSKPRRQRRIWTDQETLDLLSGVSKHGVGRWVTILSDSDYNFNSRTSVDLKDRYRVYPKDKDNKPLPLPSSKQPNLPNERTKPQPCRSQNSSSLFDQQQQQQQKKKRTRSTWTEAEDQALIKGISTHGFKWTTIHEDPDLNLGHRRPLDIKDHARYLIPGLYENSPASKPVTKSKTSGRSQSKVAGSAGSTISTGVNNNDGNSAFNSRTAGRRESATATATSASENEVVVTSRKSEKQSSHTHGQILQSDHVGVTLPRLDLDDELDWDNTLPPLLDWEDLEM